MNRNILLVLAAAVFAVGCETSSCDQSPTAPSGGSTSPSVRSEFSVSPNSVLREGDPITVSISVGGGTGSSAIAFVLVRGDGAALKVECGPFQTTGGGGTGTASINLRGAKYEWAKGQILNGAMLETHFDDPYEAFRNHGCFFLDPDQNPFTVHFERATKRTDIPLNWRVE